MYMHLNYDIRDMIKESIEMGHLQGFKSMFNFYRVVLDVDSRTHLWVLAQSSHLFVNPWKTCLSQYIQG